MRILRTDCEYTWATIKNPDTEGKPHCYKDEKEFFPQYSPNNNPTPYDGRKDEN